MIQLTEKEPIDGLLNSEYGQVRYEDWCKKEVERINAQPRRKAEVRVEKDVYHYSGHVANGCSVWVNEIEEKRK